MQDNFEKEFNEEIIWTTDVDCIIKHRQVLPVKDGEKIIGKKTIVIECEANRDILEENLQGTRMALSIAMEKYDKHAFNLKELGNVPKILSKEADKLRLLLSDIARFDRKKELQDKMDALNPGLEHDRQLEARRIKALENCPQIIKERLQEQEDDSDSKEEETKEEDKA